jgi:hypothetical protein
MTLAAAAMSSIPSVVEYPSTMPESGVGSIRPVDAKVREKPSVMAESSQVSPEAPRHEDLDHQSQYNERSRGPKRKQNAPAVRSVGDGIDNGFGEAHGGLSCRLSKMRGFGDQSERISQIIK